MTHDDQGAFSPWVYRTMGHAENDYKNILQHLNCSSVDCLLPIDAAELESASIDTRMASR